MASSIPGRRSRYVPPEETKKKGSAGLWIGLVVALLVTGLGTAWGLGFFGKRLDPRLAEVREMAKDLQKQMETGGPKNEAEAKQFAESMGKVFQKARDLPDELRGEAFRGMMRGGMMAGQKANMNAYFAANPKDREKVLDEQIKREQMLQKAMMASGAFGGRGGGPGGGGPGGGGPGGGGPGGGGGAGGGGGGGGRGGPGGGPGGGGPGGGPGGGNPEAWRKQMLDGSNPAQRAQFTEYRNAMDQRRQQLGLGNGGWGGPGGGRGGR